MELDQLYLENEVERRRIAREQLNQKLQAIRKRTVVLKAEIELGKFPDGAFESLKKNDIWKQILPFLSDPEDVENVYFTCPTFQPHLNEQRIVDKLVSAFTILVDKEYLQPKYYHYYDCCDVLLDYDDYPARDAILEFRLISKHVKRIVESNFFERPFTSQDWYLNDEAVSPDYNRIRRCAFRVPHQVKVAISAFGIESDSGHCFIRHLHVHYYEEKQKNDLLNFLEIHGHAVWGLSYVSYKGSVQENYKKISEIVCRTPNLKALSLALSLECVNASHNDIGGNNSNLHEFPGIPYLKYFSFNLDFPDYHNKFCIAHKRITMIRSILRRNNQIKTLILRHSDDFTTLQKESGVEVEELELERFEGPFYPSASSLTQGGWPLKVLHLYMDGPFQRETRLFQDNELFPVLNSFRNTLEDLSLERDIRKDNQFSGKLDLPHLKKLAILRDMEDKNGRLWFDRDYRGDQVSCISVGDLVGLKAIEELKFFKSIRYNLQNYFRAFPRLKLIGKFELN